MSLSVKKNLILLDTNALTVPFLFHIDIEKEIRNLLGSIPIKVPSSVLGELKRLTKTHPNARSALKYAERFEMIETPNRGDEAILKCALKNNAYVFTNDRKFIKKLKENKIPVLFVREKQKVVVEYP
ncbi:MAG TPA: twitching motility protein PilT [Thermoplasmata archaeon]|nr:twitching motility protein PilT [Thermoplasmata archaeon]